MTRAAAQIWPAGCAIAVYTTSWEDANSCCSSQVRTGSLWVGDQGRFTPDWRICRDLWGFVERASGSIRPRVWSSHGPGLWI